MSNDKKRRKMIILIAIVLVIINIIVFGILFLDLSKYIWPEEPTQTQDDGSYKLSADGTVNIDGVIYKIKDDNNFLVLSCENTVTNVDILDRINPTDEGTVNEIGENAFKDCTQITQINIPSTVTKINNKAFENCKNLHTLTIPYSISEIGDSCFIGCTNLSSIKVHVSNSYFSEQNGVLYDIDGKILYVYPYKKTDESYFLTDNIEVIKPQVFRGFERLSSVALPDSLNTIGAGAFENCSNLQRVLIPNSVEEIGENAFANCNQNLVIFGEKGSYAETYANENNITFQPTSEWNNPNNEQTQNNPVTNITGDDENVNTNTTNENVINNNNSSNNNVNQVDNTITQPENNNVSENSSRNVIEIL